MIVAVAANNVIGDDGAWRSVESEPLPAGGKQAFDVTFEILERT
jgi:hypothetical protein